MKTHLLIALAVLVLPLGLLNAQTTVVVQPATPQAPAAAVQPASAENPVALQASVKLLQEMKAANEETLKKQAASLLLLEELEKAAEQIKVFTSRG